MLSQKAAGGEGEERSRSRSAGSFTDFAPFEMCGILRREVPPQRPPGVGTSEWLLAGESAVPEVPEQAAVGGRQPSTAGACPRRGDHLAEHQQGIRLASAGCLQIDLHEGPLGRGLELAAHRLQIAGHELDLDDDPHPGLGPLHGANGHGTPARNRYDPARLASSGPTARSACRRDTLPTAPWSSSLASIVL